MTYSWILIIAMHSPAGDFMGKNTVGFNSQKDCEAVRVQLPNLDHPMKVRHKGLCVTRDHWEGKKKMPNVNLD
jgi:hypothetical protein